MTFTVTALLDDEFLVEETGLDKSTIIHSSAWAQVLQLRSAIQADLELDAAIDSTLGPLLRAAEEHEKKVSGESELDSYVVKEGQDHQPEVKVRLDQGGRVLHLIERGETQRLRWISTPQGDSLKVIA